jgi:cytochrome c oxidase subunit 4
MTDHGTDVVSEAPEAARVPAGSTAIVVAGEHDDMPGTAGAHHHPGPREYVIIAIVLVVLTGIEVALSYLDGDVNSSLLIGLLGVAAAIKFFLVAAWYMHMRMDAPFFRRVFVIGLVGASIVYGIAMLTFASTVLSN